MNNNYNLILARYNENLDWLIENLNIFNNIFILNKGDECKIKNEKINIISLNNIGREAQSYLYFLSNFYQFIQKNNEDTFIFSQAYPFDKSPNFINKIKNLNGEYLSLSDYYNDEEIFSFGFTNSIHPSGIPLINYYNYLFYDENLKLINEKKHKVYYNALWAVNGKNILFRNKNFYSKCLDMIPNLINPFEAYLFERLWQYIFDKKTLDWESHYNVIRKKFACGVYNNINIE